MKEKIEKMLSEAKEADQEILQALISSLATKVQENRLLEKKIEALSHDMRLLKKKLYGTSSEKLDTELTLQLDLPLFNEIELSLQAIDEETLLTEQSPPELTKNTPEASIQKSRGRSPLPKTLPRKKITHDLSELEKVCRCGSVMQCIGDVVSETLEYQPAKLWVLEHHCKKYACEDCCKKKQKR